ncbi:hypothetical protein DFH07DRAFT_863391 [Mycena maculata]|uniref:SH3 domain-containing protein n=1 Tax=Mycena maculata TaxID=230809 RepID=A0AAD7MFI0_9AGAR|nr:hypothetical protein DFH07DRAFT_863391 [Mycena maculata]
MPDEPPSYAASIREGEHLSGSSSKSPLSTSEKSASDPSSTSTASTSRDSAGHSSTRTGLLDIFRKRRHSDHPPVAVRAAVTEDVCMLVQPNNGPVSDRVALLDACAQLCARHKIDLSAILQETSIQGHTALYWAIVNSPWPLHAPFELVGAVLERAAPLKPETITEARQACVSLRNQEVFQFLRMRPEFGALTAEDRFLLGVLVPPEEIDIETMEGSAQPFSVKFKIPFYQKRMLLAREIKLEFIARGRLWQLSFFTPNQPPQKWLKHGQWSGSLRLGENSLSTHVEFGLVFLDASWPATASAAPEHATSATPGVTVYRAKFDFTGDEGEMHLVKDDVVELLEKNDNGWWLVKKDGVQAWAPSNYLELVPVAPKPGHRWVHGSSEKMLRGKNDTTSQGVNMLSWPMFGDDSVYIAPDGSVTGILGVKLGTPKAPTPRTSWPEMIPTKPDDECVVC